MAPALWLEGCETRCKRIQYFTKQKIQTPQSSFFAAPGYIGAAAANVAMMKGDLRHLVFASNVSMLLPVTRVSASFTLILIRTSQEVLSP
jgi:hypothetical protein